jgi:hypothetical protein
LHWLVAFLRFSTKLISIKTVVDSSVVAEQQCAIQRLNVIQFNVCVFDIQKQVAMHEKKF